MRNIQDANFAKELALPASNSTASTASLKGGGSFENIEYIFGHEALPNLVEDKTVTLTVEDSADNVTFAPIAALAPLVTTGGAGNGAAAASRRFRLPSTAREYTRVTAAVPTGGGTNTAAKFFIKGLF